MANPIDIAAQQLKGAVNTAADNMKAQAARQTGLVAAAYRIAGGKRRSAAAKTRVVEPDGYVRKTPVQQLRVDPDYYRAIARKLIGLAVFVAIVAVVLWVFFKTGILGS